MTLKPVADKFIATFRAEDCGIVGTRSAPIHSVNMHDDGVIEVVIDHWPQQPAEGEDIMVNTPYDVFILPLRPSGLPSGPRFVVHVPGPEQPAGVGGLSEDDIATIAWQAGFGLEKEDAEGEPTEDWQWLSSEGENMFPDLVKFARMIAALAAQRQETTT